MQNSLRESSRLGRRISRWRKAASTLVLPTIAALVFLAPIPPALGQSTSPHWWGFGVGGGITPTVGDVSSQLNTGWHFTIGGGFNPTMNWNGDPVGVVAQFMYNGFGVNPSVLRQLSVPAGNAHMWSITVDPMWRFAKVGPVGAYVILGGGFYRRTVQFTQPTTQVINVFDPWWGYVGPVAVPANQVLGTVTQNAAGVNGGFGLDFGVGHNGAEIYVEGRYHYVNTSRGAMEIVPLTFGVRW